MLINRVSQGDEASGRVGEVPSNTEDISHNFQTAHELFELMTKDHNLAENNLTTDDMVLLYKNLDIGTKLMNTANECRHKANQHVETVVYNDEHDSDESDISEIYSNEDARNIFMVNKETLDLFNGIPSFENTLCPKFGDIDMKCEFTVDYDKNFLFKDPYIKEQLKFLVSNTNEFDDTVLPASLLDYICCKRLEDNHNFYMDNIIRYVRHTIEQLKRISNGDYLTDKAKEKWREIGHNRKGNSDNIKALATSVSIPLHVEHKFSKHKSAWDDVVHSEVDIRSLSKILEKKIIIEVPKIIAGSYRLFSKHCEDNLIISCRKDEVTKGDVETESQIDVVFELKPSNSSNINSIILLHNSCTGNESNEIKPKESRCLKYEEEFKAINKNETMMIMEMKTEEDICSFLQNKSHSESDYEMDGDKNSSELSSSQDLSESTISPVEISNSTSSYNTLQSEENYKLVTQNELMYTIKRLNTQLPVPEETEEVLNNKKSPTTTRIKSPYENKSHILEEKKRKRLLEIRERREKRKTALSENCKVMKHKYNKGAIMPQASSSVTKLSITNKSFYNSIYGQKVDLDDRPYKKNRKDHSKESVSVDEIDFFDEDKEGSTLKSENKDKTHINQSSFLDDPVTEIMYVDIKTSVENDIKETYTISTSAVSNDFNAQLNLDTSLINESEIDNRDSVADIQDKLVKSNEPQFENESKGKQNDDDKIFSTKVLNLVPTNTPKAGIKKAMATVECRKSIEKIYDLMKKLGKTSDEPPKNQCIENNVDEILAAGNQGSTTFQGSDSGTSLKHHLTSSNPSSYSLIKTNDTEDHTSKIIANKKINHLTSIEPKIVVSSKRERLKTEFEKRKRVISSPSTKNPENPLKVISQFLHEFDNVQKNKHKTIQESKLNQNRKKPVVSYETRYNTHQSSMRRISRHDQHINHVMEPVVLKLMTSKDFKKPRQLQASPQTTITDSKQADKISKRKTSDIIDEAKEARGEAVRGPKLYSRLDSLAQPKRIYIQAHHDEYQTRFARTVNPHLGSNVTTPERLLTSKTTKARKASDTTAGSVKQTPPKLPLEKHPKRRPSPTHSPIGKRVPQIAIEAPYNQITMPDTPETLTNKMVAVETYVKSHYGRVSLPIKTKELQIKSRVPLIPNDIELGSESSSPGIEESNLVGKKLHHMIDNMINATTPCLSALTECIETASNDNTENISVDVIFKDEELISDSDYPVDIFQDKNVVTAVATMSTKAKDETKKEETNNEIGSIKLKDQSINSNAELEIAKLESVLQNQVSTPYFRKRLRINNLTLSPKQSVQQILLLQSGDAGSLVVKSSLSKPLKDHPSKSELISKNDLPISHLNWEFADFPMQIATVGFGLPKYPPTLASKSGTSFVVSGKASSSQINESNKKKINKTSQCFKGEPDKTGEDSELNIIGNQTSLNKAEINKDANVTEITKWISIESPDKTDNVDFENNSKSKKENIQHGGTSDTITQNYRTDIMKEKTSDIDNTNSLDILMGLLNEIRKITSCQTHIAAANTPEDNQCEELQSMLNEAAANEILAIQSPRDIISITSLEKLRQLESNTSVYSFYLSNSDRVDKDVENECCKPCCADKEVHVNIIEKEYANALTDVPSVMFPVTVSHSTHVTNSLIGIIRKPSCQSIYSFSDYETLNSNSSYVKATIPVIENYTCVPSVITLQPNQSNVITHKFKETCNYLNVKNDNYTVKYDYAQKFDKCMVDKYEINSILKMKRDILVTVYSILVLTVFAALSLPEILYRA